MFVCLEGDDGSAGQTDGLHRARIPAGVTNMHREIDATVLISQAGKSLLPFWQSTECMGARLLRNLMHPEQQTTDLCHRQSEIYPGVMPLLELSLIHI